MELPNQRKKVAVIVLLSIIGILLLGIASFVENKETTQASPLINRKQLLENIKYMQNYDGGFCEVRGNNNLGLYAYLFDTYHSLYILNELDIKLPQKQLQKLSKSMNEIKLEDIIVANTYDDINKTFYYLKIFDLLDLQANKQIKEKLIENVCNLQSNSGYFYRSLKEKEDYVNGRVQYQEENPIVLSTMNNVIEILQSKDADINKTSLIGWISDSFRHLTNTQINSSSISSIATYVRIIKKFDLDPNIISLCDVNDFYKSYFRTIDDSDINPISICDLYEIGTFLLNNNINVAYMSESLQTLNNKIMPYLKPDNKSEIPSLLTISYILKANPDIILTSLNQKNEIAKYVFSKTNYNGFFIHSFSETSNITSTYYAAMLLNKFDKKDKGIKNYIASMVSDKHKIKSEKMATSEMLMLLQLCKLYDVKLEDVFIKEYFNETLQKAMSTDYEKNRPLILLLLTTTSMYDYQYSTVEKNYFTEKIVNNENFQEESEITNEIINKSTDFQILGLINKERVKSTDVDLLVNKFVDNYFLLEDKIYATSVLIPVLEMGVSTQELSAVIIQDLKKELSEHKENGFFLYSTFATPSFESTLNSTNIIQYINMS